MNTQMTIECPCGKKHSFTNQSNYNRALRGSCLCNSCARKGQKRTNEQRRAISDATKIAMSSPIIRGKIIAGMNNPEVKQKMSENTKRQMAQILSNASTREKYIKKQSQKGKQWWASATSAEKNLFLRSGQSASKKLWNNPSYRANISEKMKGTKNPFYGQHHSEETKSKLRSATTKRLVEFWKSGRLMGINTKPELKMQSLLKKNGLEFQTPFILENKIYDLYLPKYNTLIEVDGCYWHSKNVPLSKMNCQQLRRWKNDRFKDSLAHKRGYTLLRVWEDEIEQFDIHKELIINE